ncbi:hypothetical protein [Nocardioides sp. P5_C9_2]
MDQQHEDEQHQHAQGELGQGEDGATGVAEVDAVLASLDGLSDTPVAEHVAVFEDAHERLRRALDAPSG